MIEDFPICPVQRPEPKLEAMPAEILCPILDYLSLKECLRIALVKRDFYFKSIPWIYRRVVIDAKNIHHLRLLKRLLHPKSELPAYIHELEVTP